MLSQEQASLLRQLLALLEEERGERETDLDQLPVEDLLSQWRSLVNQRPPGPASPDYLALEAAFLTSYREAHRVSLEACQATGYQRVFLYKGDLCHLQVDAVVNAANSQLLGCFIPNHACLDNALHTFAGVGLREECAQIMEEAGRLEPIGRVQVTSAHYLPATFLFHTVGPSIPQGRPVSPLREQLLAQCYLACLEEARRRQLTSLAFPALSTGEFGYPKKEAAQVAIGTVLSWLEKQNYPLDIVFSTFTEEDQRLYGEQLY